MASLLKGITRIKISSSTLHKSWASYERAEVIRIWSLEKAKWFAANEELKYRACKIQI